MVIAQLGTDDDVVPYGISDERLHRNCAGMAIEIFQQREQQAAVLTVKIHIGCRSSANPFAFGYETVVDDAAVVTSNGLGADYIFRFGCCLWRLQVDCIMHKHRFADQ